MRLDATIMRRDTVMTAVRNAGEQALAMRRRTTVVPGDPAAEVTTTADLAVEATLICALARIASWPCVSEEADRERWHDRILNLLRDRRSFWILDPIDGTSSFVEGDDRFAIQIALVHAGRLAGSWISCPALGWEVCACDGAPVWSTGLPSPMPAPLASAEVRAVIASGDFAEDHRRRVECLAVRLGSVRATRSCGSTTANWSQDGRMCCCTVARSRGIMLPASTCVAGWERRSPISPAVNTTSPTDAPGS